MLDSVNERNINQLITHYNNILSSASSPTRITPPESEEDTEDLTTEEIERALSKQLANGTMPDANGDGITDANDIEAYKNEIYDYRGERFDYFVEYSSGADMGLMSDIIINSDPSQSMFLMQSVIDYDQGNTTFLMDEVAKAGFDVFTHMAQADGLDPTMPYMNEAFDFEEIRTSIVDGMILNQTEDSIDAIARVMAVSDPSMSNYLLRFWIN